MSEKPREQRSTLDLAITSANIGGDSRLLIHGDSMGSDHIPILLCTDIDAHAENFRSTRLIFNYNKADWSNSQLLTSEFDWTSTRDEHIEKYNKNLSDAIINIAKNVSFQRTVYQTCWYQTTGQTLPVQNSRSLHSTMDLVI